MRQTRCVLVTGVQTCALPICRDDLRQGASDRGGVRIEPDRPGGRLLDPFLQRPFPRSETVDRHGWSASRWSPDHGRHGHDTARVLLVPDSTVPRPAADGAAVDDRSEEHTSELQSLMRISYAVFCLKKKK